MKKWYLINNELFHSELEETLFIKNEFILRLKYTNHIIHYMSEHECFDTKEELLNINYGKCIF